MAIAERLHDYFKSQERYGVVSAYLFGSHAEDRAHRESDVDVGVLLDFARHGTREDRFEARVLIGSDLIGTLHHNEVDVVILNDAPPLLGRAIVTRGRRVFVGDPESDFRFVRDVSAASGRPGAVPAPNGEDQARGPAE